MWCGLNAVAKLTPWTREQAWLHVRALRERRGQPLRDKPYGGVAVTDILDCLNRAGFVAIEAWPGRRRMRYGVFRRTIARDGKWLCLQVNHFFACSAKDRIHSPDALIIRAWRVMRAEQTIRR